MRRRIFLLALLAVACFKKEPDYPELTEEEKIVESPPPAYGNKVVKWPGKDSNQRHFTAFHN